MLGHNAGECAAFAGFCRVRRVFHTNYTTTPNRCLRLGARISDLVVHGVLEVRTENLNFLRAAYPHPKMRASKQGGRCARAARHFGVCAAPPPVSCVYRHGRAGCPAPHRGPCIPVGLSLLPCRGAYAPLSLSPSLSACAPCRHPLRPLRFLHTPMHSIPLCGPYTPLLAPRGSLSLYAPTGPPSLSRSVSLCAPCSLRPYSLCGPYSPLSTPH